MCGILDKLIEVEWPHHYVLSARKMVFLILFERSLLSPQSFTKNKMNTWIVTTNGKTPTVDSKKETISHSISNLESVHLWFWIDNSSFFVVCLKKSIVAIIFYLLNRCGRHTSHIPFFFFFFYLQVSRHAVWKLRPRIQWMKENRKKRTHALVHTHKEHIEWNEWVRKKEKKKNT